MQTTWTDCEDGEKDRHTHAFAFDYANPKGPKRTQTETLEESRQAASKKKNLSMELKAHRGFVGSNITILSTGQE